MVSKGGPKKLDNPPFTHRHSGKPLRVTFYFVRVDAVQRIAIKMASSMQPSVISTKPSCRAVGGVVWRISPTGGSSIAFHRPPICELTGKEVRKALQDADDERPLHLVIITYAATKDVSQLHLRHTNNRSSVATYHNSATRPWWTVGNFLAISLVMGLDHIWITTFDADDPV